MPRNHLLGQSAARRRQQSRAASVFLNIPYDSAFEKLLLAYIAAVSAFGLTPRATLEVPFGKRRLDRILSLISGSQYSIHDLSRVQLDRSSPRVPRFNMPFELGLAVALSQRSKPRHQWIVCESRRYRLNKSLSDLDGTDPYVHGGTIQGIFRELSNAFVLVDRQLNVPQMMAVYRVLRGNRDHVLPNAGAKDPFNARVFKDLCVVASRAAEDLIDRT
jgi:hypothetical protein